MTTPAVPAGGVLPADRHPARVYLAGLGSEESRRTMAGCLRRIALAELAHAGLTPDDLDGADPIDAMAWQRVRYEDATRIRDRLRDQTPPPAPATVAKHLAALRGVLEQAWLLGLASADAYERVKRVKPPTGSRVPPGRWIAPGELAALVSVCAADPRPTGARDAALFGVLYAGLRRSEVIALDLEHYRPTEHVLLVRGKGDKEGLVPFAAGAEAAVTAWLAVRGDWPGPLFVRINKAGKLSRDRLASGQAVADIIDRRASAAHVARIRPHDFRRTVASELLRVGDIGAAKQVTRLVKTDTLLAYDRLGEEAAAATMRHLQFPYVQEEGSTPAAVAGS